MMEEPPKVSTLATIHHHRELPDTPYNLWMRDELARALRAGDPHGRMGAVAEKLMISRRRRGSATG
jgi:hypothetical protein